MNKGIDESARIHSSACVDEGAEVGAETRIWHFCHIQPGARIGARCVLGQNVNIDSGVSLGDGVKVQNNVSVYRGVMVERDVFLGPSMVFTNVLNPRAHVERKSEFRTTWVRRGATIGANATVVCGGEIGAYAMVGAGAVVRGNVPAHALVVGVPARRIGWVCRCGERLHFSAERALCDRCGDQYLREEGGEEIHRVKSEGEEEP